MINSRAPQRVDLAGGTLDIPIMVRALKGLTLNCACNKYAYCSIEKRKKKGILIESLDLKESVLVKDYEKIKYDGRLDLLRGAVKVCKLKGNYHIITSNDSPKQSGLGSSSAVLVAMIAAIFKLKGKHIDHKKICELACDVEIKEMGFTGNGKQDQYGAGYGGVKLLRFYDKGEIFVDVERIHMHDSFIKTIERDMLIGYIGTRKISSDVNKRMINNFINKEKKVVMAFKNIRKITLDMAKAMEKGDVDKFAELLNEETRNRAQLDKSIVNKRMRSVIKVAVKAGCKAVKVLGAGSGGSMLFFCENDGREAVVRALESKKVVVSRFKFDFEGVRVWES